jgi:hypothetical protein
VRRCTSVEEPSGRVGTHSVSDFLDGRHYFGTISISPCYKLFILCPYITERSAWSVLTIPVTLLTARPGLEGRPFLLLIVFRPIRRRDCVSLVLRLGVLGGRSGGRTMVGGKGQDTLLCLVVGT